MMVSFSPTPTVRSRRGYFQAILTPLWQSSQTHSHCRQLALSLSCVLSSGVQNTFRTDDGNLFENVVCLAGIQCPGSLESFEVVGSSIRRFGLLGRTSIPQVCLVDDKVHSPQLPTLAYPYSCSEVITQTKIVECRSGHDDQIEPVFKHRILVQH